MTYATVRIGKGRRGPMRPVRLLVDTGADYSVLPAKTLKELGVRPEFEEELVIANGETIVRPVGRLNVGWRDRLAETFIAFGEPGDARVLGAHALESLRLEVDPKSGRVRPRRRAHLIRVAA